MHPFPPPTPFWETQAGAFVMYLLVLVPILGGVCGVLLPPSRKARSFDPVIWIVAGIVMTVVFLSLPIRIHQSHGIRDAFLIAAWGIVLFGSWISWDRRVEENESKYSILDYVITLAIFAILFVLLLPPMGHPRGESRRRQCKDNLHVLGLALYNYHDEHEALPPQAGGDPSASWRVHLLPYLGQDDLHTDYDFTADWNSPTNLPIARTKVPAYICPSVPDDEQSRDGLWFTSYAVAAGDHSLWQGDRPIDIDVATDGYSNTLLVVEACGQQIIWTEPRDMPMDETPVGINLPGDRVGRSAGILSSYHTGGAYVTFADGAVRFLSEEIDPGVLEALLTANGGEEVGVF